ncbi:hypothetical protein BJ138DRAFT_1155063 [Hygrophoropsis aurantiaca]|uniref:Uncharacterized protein n=1 Tax=Hygrophoropsis aurantiaca TaxID=72124 RepID=A0ACB8A8C2_9AGAM|nr:hypothetical protein BJ138DRAFT_1155063 [Hygrophoropsis aurantiaca]
MSLVPSIRRLLGWSLFLGSLFHWFLASMAQNTTSTNDTSYESDPILQFRPPFAQSLPVQVLFTGIVTTLTVVLLIHLIFTAQYHWPLARVNYILQLSGVTTLLISLIATVYVIFSANVAESQHWPYMLSYLAVDMPKYSPDMNLTINTNDPTVVYQHQWTIAEGATWMVMNATTSGLIQITHIHFLTLLYPSHLEARLIFGLLGPLAVIAAVMQILPIFYGSHVHALAEDIRNVCNAALSLLFTSALLIWGLLVNRRQAWRTDGGTAAFGIGAIILALFSTTLNFLYIPSQDQYAWMPKLMWAVVLWQSFLGWWWWVGAGMGVSEVEELLRREDKRERKRKLRAQKRKEQKERAKTVWKGVTGAFKSNNHNDADATTTATNISNSNEARRRNSDPKTSSGSGSDDSRDRNHRPLSRAQSRDAVASLNAAPSTVSSSSSNVPITRPWKYVQSWYASLRHAHLTAARIQAVERVERIHQAYGREDERNLQREPGAAVVGWGLGSYRLREQERERRAGMVVGRSETEESKLEGEDSNDEDEITLRNEPGTIPSQRHPQRRRSRSQTRLRHRAVQEPPETVIHPPGPDQAEEGWASVWWWGPLRRWRLQDTTAYR